MAGFAAMLRDHGLSVGIAELQAMVHTALVVPVTHSVELESAWRAIACHDLRAWRRWPDLFARFWHPALHRGTVRTSGQTRAGRTLQQVVESLHQSLGQKSAADVRADTALSGSAAGLSDAGLPRAQGGASLIEALHDRTLSQWLPQDLALLEDLAERLARTLRHQLTRRWRVDPQGHRLDIRRTLRASLRTGGVPLHPAWAKRRSDRVRLFILVDVSRSMETHAQLFLRIARAFVSAARARVFVFHTRLSEVTSLLRSDSARIQERINAVTAGFGGGTRIASSLADFREVHARAQLGRRARVWILSDGFDADPATHLTQELGELRRRGSRIVWFHPSEKPPASDAIRIATETPGLIDRFWRLNRLGDLRALAERMARVTV
jgi:uncharacterized protein with von Willebrand factor type A (vWA) domain